MYKQLLWLALIAFLALLAWMFFSLPMFAQNNGDSASLLLGKQISRCIDMQKMTANVDCVKKDFIPLLGLGKNDHVRYGQFGANAEGRFFSFAIKKPSRSQQTASIFSVTIDLERNKLRRFANGNVDRLIVFQINGGNLSGKIPPDDQGLVSIYDRGGGYYLAEDLLGKVAQVIDKDYLERSMSADSLLSKGRTIGSIMEERIEWVEQNGQGGPSYLNDAESFEEWSLSEAKKEQQEIFWF